jgi:hypothetical protein
MNELEKFLQRMQKIELKYKFPMPDKPLSLIEWEEAIKKIELKYKFS